MLNKIDDVMKRNEEKKILWMGVGRMLSENNVLFGIWIAFFSCEVCENFQLLLEHFLW